MPLAVRIAHHREGKSTQTGPGLLKSASRETCQHRRQRADGVFRDWLWERAYALPLLAQPRSVADKGNAR